MAIRTLSITFVQFKFLGEANGDGTNTGPDWSTGMNYWTDIFTGPFILLEGFNFNKLKNLYELLTGTTGLTYFTGPFILLKGFNFNKLKNLYEFVGT